MQKWVIRVCRAERENGTSVCMCDKCSLGLCDVATTFCKIKKQTKVNLLCNKLEAPVTSIPRIQHILYCM